MANEPALIDPHAWDRSLLVANDAGALGTETRRLWATAAGLVVDVSAGLSGAGLATEATLQNIYNSNLSQEVYLGLVITHIDTGTSTMAGVATNTANLNNTIAATASTAPSHAIQVGLHIETTPASQSNGNISYWSGNKRGMGRVEIGDASGNAVSLYKEGTGNVGGGQGLLVLAFKSSTNIGTAPVLDASGRIIVAVNSFGATLANVTTVATVSTVNAVIPGTGATNLGKAEDAAHASGDTGVFALGVRRDTLGINTSNTNDYSALAVDNYERLHVRTVGDFLDIQSDTYTGAANGATVDCSIRPKKNFTLQIIQTGVVTAWDVRLEGSLDNTNFGQMVQHTNADGTNLKFSSNSPVPYFRTRCAAITLGAGTNVIAKIIATD